MIKVTTGKDHEQTEVCHKLVTCPLCGQKLTDVSYVKGIVVLRVKCRRCKAYINIDIVGTE